MRSRGGCNFHAIGHKLENGSRGHMGSACFDSFEPLIAGLVPIDNPPWHENLVPLWV